MISLDRQAFITYDGAAFVRRMDSPVPMGIVRELGDGDAQGIVIRDSGYQRTYKRFDLYL